jgi:hypothetical protein
MKYGPVAGQAIHEIGARLKLGSKTGAALRARMDSDHPPPAD